jgi:dihydrofolate reductase
LLDARVKSRHDDRPMRASVFIGTSVDGFIARADGALDFLPPDGGEPHGYNEFFASVDALVIGRKTYETVRAFPEWPYGQKRVVVLSSQSFEFSKGTARNIEQMSGDPGQIVAKLAASGIRHIYVDGGVTIQRFLRAGIIDRLIITRVPVLIGHGIPLFDALPHDIHLKHIATQTYKADWSRLNTKSSVNRCNCRASRMMTRGRVKCLWLTDPRFAIALP